MMSADGAPAIDDAALWAGVNEHVRATRGYLGFSKMLGARDDEDAARRWLGAVRPILDRLAPVVTLRYSGPARLEVDHGIAMQLHIHDVTLFADDVPRLKTMMLFDPAALTLALVGRRRWGDRWSTALLGHGSRRPVVPRSVGTDTETFPWVAQNPGTPGPWTSAATQIDAEIAANAEDLGFDRVTALYRNFEGATNE